MSKVYIITGSDDYYPCQGSGDWIAIRWDRAEAESFFKGLVEMPNRSGMGKTYHLIEIDSSYNADLGGGWRTLETVRVEYTER